MLHVLTHSFPTRRSSYLPISMACMASSMAIQGLWIGPWLRDVAGLELATEDVDRFVSIVSALEPSFGAINLEDIRAPDRSEEHTSELQSLMRTSYAV